MSTSTLQTFSNELADAVAAVAPSVVQVQGRRSPASGIVFQKDAVLTTLRVIGRENGLKVRDQDGRELEAELAGWDLTTHIAVLRASGLNASNVEIASRPPRVGELVVGVGRSLSNVLSASTGIVSVIGGPLPTGRGRAIERVIRTNAPMHRGFAGGALIDAAGRLTGVVTAAEIRGFRVAIPADIAWKAAADALQHGRPRRGFLGLAGQQVALTGSQRDAAGSESALLIAGVVEDSPAARAGLQVGDLLLTFDAQPVDAPDALLDALTGDRVGRPVPLRVLRGGEIREIVVTVGEKRASS